MKNKLKYILLLFGGIILFSCGEGVVEVTNESYEPKIVMEGYLIANQKVDKIHITRNFRLNSNLTNLIPNVNSTSVIVTDLENNRSYPLSFHVAPDDKLENYYWQYNGSDLIIRSGRSYRLDVTTIIEGKQLQASSTTTVPDSGFSIDHINYNQLVFREYDQNNILKHFEITFNRSPGITFYLVTAKAMNPKESNFIYENPFLDEKEEDVNINDYDYQYGWVQDTPTTIGQTIFTVFWANLWFYDNYRVVVYATDKNYREYVQTYNDVQEDDGNFHEAKFNIEGDGIGVFGSMIADTINIEVLRN